VKHHDGTPCVKAGFTEPYFDREEVCPFCIQSDALYNVERARILLIEMASKMDCPEANSIANKLSDERIKIDLMTWQQKAHI